MHSWKPILATAGLAAQTSALQVKGDVGKLPALGWNSWNAYHCDVNADKIMEAAQAVVDLGLKDAGYEYVNIDDCWSIQNERDNTTNRIIPDPSKFPDGISGVTSKIHDLGLKAGIYSSAGTATCAGYPASLYNEETDAAAFADWGIDYLKYDNCGAPSNESDTCHPCYYPDADGPNGTCIDADQPRCAAGYDYSQSNTANRFARMRDALAKQDRPILYALCEWGSADVETWGAEMGQSWRSTQDIDQNWASIINIINQNSFYTNYGSFYAHNDPDMLEVGNGNITYAECRSHFALWAAMKSPLLIGTDLQALSVELVDVLKNPYLLAFNQDAQVSHSAAPYKWGYNPDWTFDPEHPAQYWSGNSTAGTMVLLLNTDAETKSMEMVFEEIPELIDGADREVVDAWSGKSLGCTKDGAMAFDVESHDTAVLLVKGIC